MIVKKILRSKDENNNNFSGWGNLAIGSDYFIVENKVFELIETDRN